MEDREKGLRIAQLKALGQEALRRAELQEMYSGRIAPTVIAEVYRIGHQILAILEDRVLDESDPMYLLGLFSALLKLHEKDYEKQKVLYGRPDPQTIAEIERLKALIEGLKGRNSASEGERQRPVNPEIQVLESGLDRLLTS